MYQDEYMLLNLIAQKTHGTVDYYYQVNLVVV